ncbi:MULTISPECIES: hypothetical protein [unclassified Rhizobacter]|uniref:hypothetical protein n=1 Tax=unclassified Rhizobacter TaxID=2640088 RepID=UPI001910E3BB|nr:MULTISPECIES: hypothetical protein [unclassified Rhizobacter]
MKKSLMRLALATDIGHLGQHGLEFVHHLRPDPADVGQLRALAQHRFGQVEALAHGGLHGGAMGFVEGMHRRARRRSVLALKQS